MLPKTALSTPLFQQKGKRLHPNNQRLFTKYSGQKMLYNPKFRISEEVRTKKMQSFVQTAWYICINFFIRCNKCIWQ